MKKISILNSPLIVPQHLEKLSLKSSSYFSFTLHYTLTIVEEIKELKLSDPIHLFVSLRPRIGRE